MSGRDSRWIELQSGQHTQLAEPNLLPFLKLNMNTPPHEPDRAEVDGGMLKGAGMSVQLELGRLDGIEHDTTSSTGGLSNGLTPVARAGAKELP